MKMRKLEWSIITIVVVEHEGKPPKIQCKIKYVDNKLMIWKGTRK